jgi:CrcB protein
LKLFLITGICGGFTTFSAFTFENLQLIQTGHTGTAVIYTIVSVFLGILAVIGGLWLSKQFA